MVEKSWQKMVYKYLFHFFHFFQVPSPQKQFLVTLHVVFPPPNNTGDTPSARVRDPEISPCAVAICVGAAVAAKELAVGKTAKARMQPKGGRKAWKRPVGNHVEIGLEKKSFERG